MGMIQAQCLFIQRPPSKPKKLIVAVIVAVIVAGPVVVAVHVHGNATVAVIARVKDR